MQVLEDAVVVNSTETFVLLGVRFQSCREENRAI
jgi:hypothetical protein